MKKRVLACTLAAFAACGTMACMTSCSNVVDLSGKLAIWVLDAGYGTAWIDEMVKEYNKIYPDVEVAVVKDNTIASKFDAAIKDPSSNEYDLIFSNILNVNQYVGMNYKVGGKVYEDLVLNLSDNLYNKKPIGKDGVEESVTVGSKIRAEFKDVVTNESDKEMYAYPYAGGASGIIYNAKLFEEKNWEVPETTDELLELTYKIYNEEVVGKKEGEKIYPWVWTGKCPSYWQQMEYAMYGTYVGFDNYRAFWQAKEYQSADGSMPGTPSNGDLSARTPEVFNNKGRLDTLTVMEKILYPDASDSSIKEGDERYDHGYCVPYSSSASVDKAQYDFMNGNAAMYVCGSWFEREMEDWFKENPNADVELKVMKTPVLSSAKAMWDEALAEDRVTQKEYDQAMNMQFSGGADLTCVIPAYSTEQEQAINFLRFMSSDYGAMIYAKYAKSILPLNYNWSDSSFTNTFKDFVKPGSFLQSQIDLDKTCTYAYDGSRINKVFYQNSIVEFFPNGQFPEPKMSSLVRGERRTALQLFNSYYSTVTGGWQGVSGK
ncbi:MAG: extracellular solute-binding protein [Clostridiales bacterium]|nr:extracellular solute-binding protein [Clostridiales bacterium]